MKTVKIVFVPIVVLLLVFLVTNVCDAYNYGDIIIYSGSDGPQALIYDGSNITNDIKDKINNHIPVSDLNHSKIAEMLDLTMYLDRGMSSSMQNDVNAINEENIDKELEKQSEETENKQARERVIQDIEGERQARERFIEKNDQAIMREIQARERFIDKNYQAVRKEKQNNEGERQAREQLTEKNKQPIGRETQVKEGERQARQRFIEKNNEAVRKEQQIREREKQIREREKQERENRR